jgi:DNA ligase-1
MKYFLLITLFFLSHSFQAIAQKKPAIQLATTYKTTKNINDYWVSEKLDGMRAYWTGKQLLTRQGNLIYTPLWFTENWPTTVMEGELWIGRDQFQQTLSCVRKVNIDEHCWRKVRFMIFDLPTNPNIFTLRIDSMKKLVKQSNSENLDMINQFKLNTDAQLESTLNRIITKNGEGLMLHLGNAHYHKGRTANIMKLKRSQDAEATVVDYLPGRGKYIGMMGAMTVKTINGITFKIGSGFTDAERAKPPAIGSIITYKYNGKTLKGIPRFARYWRVKN